MGNYFLGPNKYKILTDGPKKEKVAKNPLV